MKTKIILFTACVCALVITCVAALPAFACEPRSETDPRCDMPRPKPRVVARVTPTPIKVAAAPTAAPTLNPNTGGNPSDALPIEGKWQVVNAGQAKWYRIDNGPSFYMDVWIDTKEKLPLRIKAFAPAKSNEMGVNMPATGEAHPPKDTTLHDYLYQATHAEGVWYLVVINLNPSSVEHRVSVDVGADNRQCRTFTRIGRDGQPFLYTDCGMYNMNK